MMPALGIGLIVFGLLVAVALAHWLPQLVVRRRCSAAGLTFTAPEASIAAVNEVALDVALLRNGELRVSTVTPFDPEHDRNLRWFAGALSHAAHDPIGRAVAKLSTTGRLSQVEEVQGAGIRGSVDRHPVRIGTPQWVGITEASDPVAGVAATIAVEVDAKALGTITLVDVLRQDVAEGLAALSRLGVRVLVLPGKLPARTQLLADEADLLIGESDVTAEAGGLSVGVEFSAPSVPAVAAAICIARRARALRRWCLTGGVILGMAAVLAGLWLLAR